MACVALTGLTIILGTVSIWSINGINAQVHLLQTDALPGTASSARLMSLMQEQRALVLRHILSESPEQMSQTESAIADGMSRFQTELNVYEKTISSPVDRELFGKIAPANEQFVGAWTKVRPISRELKTKEAYHLWNAEGFPAVTALNKVLQDLVAENKASGDAYVSAAVASGAAARFWTLAILAFSLVSGGLLAFLIVRGINQALTQAVTELSEGASQVTSASGQVSGSSQSLAQGASEQAASLEQTSASGAEMAATTRKNSESSQQAAELMRIVSQSVATANKTLADMTASMQEIGSSSGKISKIIKVIDEIAFQTNILALNAAVEAARAGEAGMGFAVVADEVRNLAQRSAQAAKDTASLIEDSILKSTEGSRKLGEVAASIQSITEGAGKVKTLIDEVEASSKEQAQGIEQISKAVAQMEEVTQRSAASAEETASASEELNAQSQALMAVVGNLQAMAGTGGNSHSELQRASFAAKRPQRANLVRNSPGLRAAAAASGKPTPALIRATAHGQAEFPLDDTEFKEF